MEEWRDIEGFPWYAVSNTGRVVNVRSNRELTPCVDRSNGYAVVNLYDETGKPRRKYLHRLMAEAFLPNPDNKRTINHIDCNKSNNTLDNIEWATDSENMRHAFQNGLCENTRQSAYIQQRRLAEAPRTDRQREAARENIVRINKRPKTERQLEASRRAVTSQRCQERAMESHLNRHPPIRVIETGKIYRSQRELAEELGIGESAVCACLHGRRKHAGGYHFEYVDQEAI